MKNFYLVLAFVAVSIICNTANKKIRIFAQYHKDLHELIIANDLCIFALNGGGSLGYDNYFKWHYAKWINDPKRTAFQKAMFWKMGIIYDASNPPKEYEYPLLN